MNVLTFSPRNSVIGISSDCLATRVAVVLTAAAFCGSALATQGMKFNCKPMPDGTILQFEGVTIVDYTDGTKIPPDVYTTNPIRFRCQSPAGLIRLHVEMYAPRERGECGLDPGGDLSLSIEGIQVVRRVRANVACFTSVKTGKLSLMDAKKRTWRLELCGPVRGPIRDTRGITEKCIERRFIPSKEQLVFDLESFEEEMLRP
jgi:hypothetical protein